MKVERVRPTVIQLTAHASELAALISAARWVAEGRPGQLPDEAVEQLRRVLADYDQAMHVTG
ncbi:MAG TPA: hypothetical protein VKB75_04770 [Jatrophihabitans sp.]|nr:hypothetical protein [Jatrophihabitans sp.]